MRRTLGFSDPRWGTLAFAGHRFTISDTAADMVCPAAVAALCAHTNPCVRLGNERAVHQGAREDARTAAVKTAENTDGPVLPKAMAVARC